MHILIHIARTHIRTHANPRMQTDKQNGDGVLTLFRLGVGACDATQDLNPLLLTNDCVYSVPTTRLFLKFTWEQFGVVRFW